MVAVLYEPDLEPNPVVRVDGLNFAYGEGDARNQVLFDISCAVQPGQLVVMTGPSGSGKTTLLTLIGALALLPLQMTWQLTLLSLGLTLAMCVASALLAIRRVIAADPAEIF